MSSKTDWDQKVDWSHFLDESLEAKLNSSWARASWRIFSKFIAPNSTILEVGCGSGRLSARAARLLEAKVVAMDISADQLRYARNLCMAIGTSCSLTQASGFEIPFTDNSFDVVMSEGVIEHFEPNATKLMVDEHARVCRSGGKVIISVPNVLNLPLSYHKWRVGKNFVAYPERSYSVWKLQTLMRNCSLKIVAKSGFAPGAAIRWYYTNRINVDWLDRLDFDPLLSLIGYEVLVVGEKI